MGEVVGRVLVGEGLELARTRVPLGVVLVVFESRPDCLPQVSPDCLPQVGLFWNPSLPTVGDALHKGKWIYDIRSDFRTEYMYLWVTNAE